jgi:hypothetical protein
VAPNHFGYIGVKDQRLLPIITTTIDATRMPGPDGRCRMAKG